MTSTMEWSKYVDSLGNFEFPKYLYKSIMDMMKINLDLGTLVCNDPSKLRAFKERVKATYKEKWLDIASILEYCDLIEPCVCKSDTFCQTCGGSRYLLSGKLTADEIRRVSAVPFEKDPIAEKLRIGLAKAEEDVQNFVVKHLMQFPTGAEI